MPTTDIHLKQIPQWLLWQCLKLHLTAKQAEEAITSGRFSHHDPSQALGKYLLLRSITLTDDEWEDSRTREFAGSRVVNFPDRKDMIALSHQEAIDVLKLEMPLDDYFTARKLGMSHKELTTIAKLNDRVDLEGYAKLRKEHQLSAAAVQKMIKDGVQLSNYSDLIRLKLDKPTFDRVVELYGKNLGMFIELVRGLKLDPAEIIARTESSQVFDLYKYSQLRKRNQLSDQKAMAVMQDPELLAGMGMR